MIEPATRRARRGLTLAAREAMAHGDAAISTAYLLLGLCLEREGVAARALTALGVGNAEIRRGMEELDSGAEHDAPTFEERTLAALGIDLDDIQQRADDTFGAGALVGAGSHDRYTAGLRNVLEHARFEALGLGHAFIGTEHLLLGILDEPDCQAARVLAAHGVPLTQIQAAVLDRLQTLESGRKRLLGIGPHRGDT